MQGTQIPNTILQQPGLPGKDIYWCHIFDVSAKGRFTMKTETKIWLPYVTSPVAKKSRFVKFIRQHEKLTILVHDLPLIMMFRGDSGMKGLQGLKAGQLSIHHFSLQAGSSE